MEISNKRSPSIRYTVVGFGQAGSRIADKFAEYRNAENMPIYQTYALNSNDGDLTELKHIPIENRVSLRLGGLGKNPEKATRILKENQEAGQLLKHFITERVQVQDDVVLFCAGLGGGTGTATIVRAIEEFHQHHNLPIFRAAVAKAVEQIGREEFESNRAKYQTQVFKAIEPKFKKLGIIVTLPTRSDGPDVLRQVNDFARQIWELTTKKVNGVYFTLFADNQMFYDRFEAAQGRTTFTNYRDFANSEIVTHLHRINMGTNVGGTSVTFDSNDFRRILTEEHGCFVLNYAEAQHTEIQNNNDLKDLIVKSLVSNKYHDAIRINSEQGGDSEIAKVYHLGILAILPPEMQKLGSAFIDQAKTEIIKSITLDGTVFSGYLVANNNYKVTAYTFYKVSDLPARLVKGLVEEYKEFMQKRNNVQFKTAEIERIEAEEEVYDLDFNILGDDTKKPNKEKSVEENLKAIMDIDFTNLDINKL